MVLFLLHQPLFGVTNVAFFLCLNIFSLHFSSFSLYKSNAVGFFTQNCIIYPSHFDCSFCHLPTKENETAKMNRQLLRNKCQINANKQTKMIKLNAIFNWHIRLRLHCLSIMRYEETELWTWSSNSGGEKLWLKCQQTNQFRRLSKWWVKINVR